MFAYCLNNPVNYSDPSGNLALIDDAAALVLVYVFGVAIISFIMSPPVQKLIWDSVEYVYSTFDGIVRQIGEIYEAKTKGKENIRDSGLANQTDAEIIEKAHNRKLPPEERKRYQREEKARGLRNRSKRESIYFACLE